MDEIIKTAISTKKLLEFTYDGLSRIAEPHVYGVKDGKYELLVYQIRGQSRSGGLPNWRRVELKKVSNMRILDESFLVVGLHHLENIVVLIELLQ